MTKKRFLLSLHTRDNDFQLEQAVSAEQAARQLGVDLEIAYADNDAVNQSTQILKALQRDVADRPHGIILEPITSLALPQAAHAASAAGVAWVLLNRVPDYLQDLRKKAKAQVFAVTSDHTQVGRIQGQQMAAILPDGGTVLLIEGPAHSAAAHERTAGMKETKPDNISLVTLRGQWTEQSSQRAVRSWLKLATARNATIDLIAGQDDSMAMGARKALEELPHQAERTRWLTLPFIGCDGMPATGQAWVQQGTLAATVYIPPNSAQAMKLLLRALETGIQPPERVVTESHSIPAIEDLQRQSRLAAK
jgi:ABC-type sugar transport system substrate-binding protein